MRLAHCTVAVVLLASLPAAAEQPGPVPSSPVEYTVFYKGMAIGVEQVTVTSSTEGIRISGTERLAAPLSVTVRSAEIRYSPDWRLQECRVEGSLRDQLVILHVTVAGTTATTIVTQGTASAQKVDELEPNTIALPTLFLGAHAALAARLDTSKPGDELWAFVPAQALATIQVVGVVNDRVRTQAGLLEFRRYNVRFISPGRSSPAEVWVGAGGSLLRFTVPEQSVDILRDDIATVSTRREPVSRPNDEQVTIPAYGFSLAGTVSKPAAAPKPPARLPAVVLVGAPGPADRDGTTAGIPILGQVSSALADAGYLVLRYDQRGVGQSGGRAESATLGDYAEDAVAAVKHLKNRKDVDGKRIALVGYAEGGAAAMLAAARSKDVAALALLAAPGVSGAVLTLDQQRHALSRLNIPDAEKQAKIELQEKIQHAVMTGQGLDGIPPAMRKQADTFYFRSLLLFDPAKTMKDVGQPVLIVQGELDRQVDPSNADKLAALAGKRKGAAGQAVQLIKIPGINHLLVPATTGEADEYPALANAAVSPQVAAGIDAWLKATMKPR